MDPFEAFNIDFCHMYDVCVARGGLKMREYQLLYSASSSAMYFFESSSSPFLRIYSQRGNKAYVSAYPHRIV